MDVLSQGAGTQMGIEPINKNRQATSAWVFFQTLQILHGPMPLMGAAHRAGVPMARGRSETGQATTKFFGANESPTKQLEYIFDGPELFGV